MTTQTMPAPAPDGGRPLDDVAAAYFTTANGLAEATGDDAIRASHVFLAVLSKDADRLDAPCRAVLRGLKARTFAEALHDRLRIDADERRAGRRGPESPRGTLADDAKELVSRAQKYTAAWGLSRVPGLAVTCAACDGPGASVERVLGPLGIGAAAVAEVGARVLKESGIPVEPRRPVELYEGDILRLDAFDATLQGAWRVLTSLAASRPLLDVDLLKALVEQLGSQLAQALAEIGVTPAEAVRRLVGEAKEENAAGRPAQGSGIARGQIGRLLSRVLPRAAELALAANAERVREVDVLLAHLERVGTEAGSVYARIGLDAERLRARFAKADEAGPEHPFDKDALRLDAFGPVARAALVSLVPAAQQRALVDTDLLHALVGQPLSHLVDALHVIGVAMPVFRRAVQPPATTDAGRTEAGSTDAPVASVIPKARVSSLLGRVLIDAAAMARREECELIGESHLVRAHISRVAGGSLSIYERLGIDTLRLAERLRGRPTDAEAAPEAQQPSNLVVDVETYLKARVVNQEEAVTRASKALRRMRSGLGEPGQVLGKYFFVGATGVGKTELARAMADVAFGINTTMREAHMIRIDCGVFQDKRDVVQLVGAAQGLVGYKEGQLTNGLRDKPKSVILFDEAEKADRAIWQSLLPLFDEGIVREADGTVYDATNCIIVLTSNAGYGDALTQHDAWNRPWESVRQQVQDSVWAAVQTYLSPELRGRFGRENIIFFNHFGKSDYEQIVSMQLTALVEEMAGRGIELTFADRSKAVDMLVAVAWKSREEGARPVRRLITEQVRDQMVNARVEDPRRSKFRFAVEAGAGQLKLVG